MANLMQIPISKGTGLFIEVDLDEIASEEFPAEVYKEIMFQGLKQVLNRGYTKQESTKGKKGAELERENAACLEIAKKNLQAMREGEVRITGGKAKAKGMTREVNTEATRIAKAMVKDAIKREGKVKVSTVPSKEITALAKQVLEGDHGTEIYAMAKENVEKRNKQESGIGIDISGVKADPKLVAANEKKKAKDKEASASKKAAQQVQHRARPETHARH